MTVRSTTRAACAAVAALAVVAGSMTSAAAAAGHGRHAAASHHGKRGHHKPARAAAFSLHGVVVGVSGDRVRVVVAHGKVGARRLPQGAVTLKITRTTRRHNTAPTRRHRIAHAHSLFLAASAPSVNPSAVPVGTAIDATGTASGGTLTVTSETTRPLPAETLFGQVTAVRGSLVTVAAFDEVDGEDLTGDQEETHVLDLAAAKVNGAAGSGSAVRPGQYLLALGEDEDDVMAVAHASVFDAAPRVVLGVVSSTDAAAKTLTVAAQDDRQDDEDAADVSPHDVVVDASEAEVVVNGEDRGEGRTMTAQAFPAAGDKVLVVAPGAAMGSSSLAATLIFAFDRRDQGAVGQNEG